MAKKKNLPAVKGSTAPAKMGDLFESHAGEGFEGADSKGNRATR